MSDSYREYHRHFENLVRATTSGGGGGDPNSLAMFVADRPHHAEGCLQLGIVLHHVDDRAKGNELLRRAAYVYESASFAAIFPSSSGTSTSNNNTKNNKKHIATKAETHLSTEVLLDHTRPPNAGFFTTLFWIMQTSGMAGCLPAALATSRVLQSLDPMGALLVMDYYA